ncbi:MAG: caspase family protein [Armatimonadetes bacterium]|nr:caspase family protein [Armatimonadota bacterium]
MSISRKIWIFGLFLSGGVASAQSWTDAYEKGLSAARGLKWMEARGFFKKAASLRTEDFSDKTMLPGSVTDPKIWRNGAPYSPNFLGAYAGFKYASSIKDDKVRSTLLTTVANEFMALIEKGQKAPETFYYLTGTYVLLNDPVGQKSSSDSAMANKSSNWKVDSEVIAPEEKAAVVSFMAGPSGTGTATVTVEPAQKDPVAVAPEPPRAVKNQKKPKSPTDDSSPVVAPKPPKAKVDPAVEAGPAAKVNEISGKFALVIGNSNEKLDAGINFGDSDAANVKEQLIQNAGYSEANIETLTNATSAEIMAKAAALAAKVEDRGVVTIYFSGVGTHLSGKDYLAGIDTLRTTDASTMVEKAALFRIFMAKGAKVFSFFQVNRPLVDGKCFGMEASMVGQVAQMQATVPGGKVFSTMRGGKPIGLFTEAFGTALSSMRTNRVPILEFGWLVFDKIRNGGGTQGGGSLQIPTLPVYTNMGSDSKF